MTSQTTKRKKEPPSSQTFNMTDNDTNKDDDDENENDEFLSEHTKAMRRAVRTCRDAVLNKKQLFEMSSRSATVLHPKARRRATLERVRHYRQEALARAYYPHHDDNHKTNTKNLDENDDNDNNNNPTEVARSIPNQNEKETTTRRTTTTTIPTFVVDDNDCNRGRERMRRRSNHGTEEDANMSKNTSTGSNTEPAAAAAASLSSSSWFRRNFHQANVPCRIIIPILHDEKQEEEQQEQKQKQQEDGGELSHSFFVYVQSSWRTPSRMRQWMRHVLDKVADKNRQPKEQQKEQAEKEEDGSYTTTSATEKKDLPLLLPVRYSNITTNHPQKHHQQHEYIVDNRSSSSNSNETTNATAAVAAANGPLLLLDENGRARESQTIHMSLSDWIAHLDNAAAAAAATDGAIIINHDSHEEDAPSNHAGHYYYCYYYLKDWHFESWLEAQQHMVWPCRQSLDNKNNKTNTKEGSASMENEKNNSLSSCSFGEEKESLLYQLPEIFQYDLLNPFLRAFTGGDYRFVYWGPKGSRTDWHSDVLHSFSWSYNVYGTKEWTFIVPRLAPTPLPVYADEEDETTAGGSKPGKPAARTKLKMIKVIQRAGECIFVPATWKHQVINLEETVSINRNWCTAANLDLCWDCLWTEMQSIESELTAWGVDYDWEARESMLRGCVGLDVTAFYLMILYRLTIIVTEQHDTLISASSAPCGSSSSNHGDVLDDDVTFETVRCVETVRILLENKVVNLSGRLQATLANPKLSIEAIKTGEFFCHLFCGGEE